MSTNHHNNTSYVDLYLLEMDLAIEEGLVDLDYYQRLLLKGCLTKEQEKGLKTSKETLYKQIFEEIFHNSNITNGGSHVKTKLHWLESQYIAIKKTFSQTGSGLLLHNLSPDHLDFASHSAAVDKYPWFKMFHKMMPKHPSTGPVTLVTSGAYDPLEALQSSNGDSGNAMEEDDISFPSGCSIPGLEALAETAPDNPIGPRVLSLSSAFPSPSTLSNPFGLPGATPHNHLASTAFGVDQEPESAALSSPTKKTSPSKKQDDIADLV
ncbi:uncharacterized protein UBRO_20173 [Ustilago bromivora]|uniref:Myb/SANT-like domain-containing protein n=1 Tax=Ustilago bromivora TaxID=307758 RepID=A0A1K0GCQ5_9BASI|nr:uncharacterized protein UBRO_20173 [Ustilago bromivora]